MLTSGNLMKGATMIEATNPERIITTTSGEEKALKDAHYDELPSEVSKFFTQLEVLPPNYPDHRALHADIISAQENFEPGFVATSTLEEQFGRSRIDVQRDYEAGTETFSIGRVLAMAYEEKAIRDLIDQAKTDDPEKADYIRTYTSLDADNPNQARDDRAIAEWASVLFSQTEAQAEGWTPERLFEAEIELKRIQTSISGLEELAGVNDKEKIQIRNELYMPLVDIIRDTCKTHGIWKNNPIIEEEYEKRRAKMMEDPTTTLGDLREVIREWLEHEPREDHGGSEGLLYSLRLDRDFYIKRLQAIQNGTYAQKFAQPKADDQ